MALFVRLRNINPIGAVLTVLDGEAREVGKGEVIEVSPEQAGTGPHWRPLRDGEVVESHQSTRESEPGSGVHEIYDLGTGCLAQVANWEIVKESD